MFEPVDIYWAGAWTMLSSDGPGVLPGPAWPGAAILSSGGKLGDLSGIDVEPELSRVLALQGSAVLCAAAAWAVLPCQSVQCVWVISDNIINYLKKSADQCPATGCGSVKTSLTWHGESLSRRTSQSCVTWGMGWGLRGEWWAAQWVDQSYQISSSELTQHLNSQTEKIIFSKLDSSGPGPGVIKCASNNKVPPTNVKECVQYWW